MTVNGTTERGKTRYYPWGKERFTSGSTLTSFKYTGQRYEDVLGFGLYYYGARWYDRTAGAKHHPTLGRFIWVPRGRDTIVPNSGRSIVT